MERFGQGVRLVNRTVPGLVERIEAGDLEGPETRSLIFDALQPILAEGADTLVLACTHYPFVIPLIQAIAGPAVRVIDPAPAIARQTERVLATLKLPPSEGRGRLRVATTGLPARLTAMVARLLGEDAGAEALVWKNGALQEAPD